MIGAAGLYDKRGVGQSKAPAAPATVDWFNNNNRLYEENGDIPPVEVEQAYYRQHRSSA